MIKKEVAAFFQMSKFQFVVVLDGESLTKKLVRTSRSLAVDNERKTALDNFLQRS